MDGAANSKKSTRRHFRQLAWPGFLCSAVLSATFSHAAERFDASHQPLGSVAPISLSGTNLAPPNDVKAYRTWFENGSWQGDLIEYEVSHLGALSSGIDLSGTSPAVSGNPPDTWSANIRFALGEIANASYWDTGREIITLDALGAQVPFVWSNGLRSIADSQKAALDQVSFDAGDSSSPILEYIRGKRDSEFPHGILRARTSILGDLIHSNPVYVAAPKAGFNINGYAAWATENAQATREARVYVGSNSGMLHAFDALTGDEEWAYIPSMLFPNLGELAKRPYQHKYYVDGQLTVQDAYYGSDWHTVLVGGLGAGGKGWFGLDITNADLTNQDSRAGGNAKILWELGENDSNVGDDLGDAFGQAVIVRLSDDNWYAVIGNGYNSVNGKAILFLVNVQTGVVTPIPTPNGYGSADSPNGLSSPTLVDRDGNGTADIVYAGDIDGNVWKFDITDVDNPTVEYGKPLYAGSSTQPVIQPPDVSRHPVSGFIVLFGTGRLFTNADIQDTSTQGLYGIWDSGAEPPANPNLLAQTLSGDQAYTAARIEEIVQTIVPDQAIDWNIGEDQNDGWVVSLPSGFRVLQPPQLRAGRLKVTVSRPVNHANYLVEPDYLDGGSPEEAIFDLNQSGDLNVADNIDGNADGDLADGEDAAMMWARPNGIMSRPTIARVANGVDAQLINFLVPPPGEPCEGDCPDGFKGGYVDLTTDYLNDVNGGTGDAVLLHSERYDKQVGRTYADFLDLLLPGHAELDDATYLDGDMEFIIVVANADRSPGSKLILGAAEYNVVEYQALVHRKLRDWDGVGPLTDDAGNSLIFAANDLVASGGTVRHSFNELAILEGGLHATDTLCLVYEDNAGFNDRYRNGALVTQALDRSIFSDGSGLDNVYVQNPGDMAPVVTLKDGTEIVMEQDFNNNGSIDPSNYERFGGLRAKKNALGDNTGLFEATLFWHYGERSCYGSGDYEQQLAEAIDALILEQAEFDELLASLNIADLDEEVLASQSCKDIDDDDGGCRNRYQILMALLALEATIFVDGQVIESGIDGTNGVPVIVGGDARSQGITVGPNFAKGRRNWVDLIAD